MAGTLEYKIIYLEQVSCIIQHWLATAQYSVYVAQRVPVFEPAQKFTKMPFVKFLPHFTHPQTRKQ